MYRKMRGAYNTLIGKHEGKRQLGRPRSRWEYNLEWILGTQGENVWIGCI
jgi:hypothetical protein